jgi:hypothetical protein
MTTRTIITSQPDVACDVCERRLLRGEQHDIFLAAGHRRTVCELCAPRALHEGWRRESDTDAVILAPPRPRRGRNLFERLLHAGKPALSPAAASAQDLVHEPDATPYEPAEAVEEAVPVPQGQHSTPRRRESQPYDFLGGLEIVEDMPATADDGQGAERAAAWAAQAASPVDRAVEIFNSSEFPRRIAGIARSLGAPAVNVGAVEDTVGDTVAIVVAWELCWYRYEVDLDAELPAARLAAQGTELEELARGERVGNTPIDELGALYSASAA